MNKSQNGGFIMLVKIVGKKGEEQLVTSSLKVAEKFGKAHKDVLESIREILAAENSATKLFYEDAYKNRGKDYPMFYMNRDGFSLLVMGFTGKEALKWKLEYIQAFNEMEKELKRLYEERKQWEIERAKGILTRHILTDTIKNIIPDSPHKRFIYPNYTKLIYKTLFNMNMNQLREKYGIKSNESVRDYLTADELAEVETLERLISSLINYGWGYEQVKSFVLENATKRIAS
jgi:Rha family phage regulatory protein